MRTLAAVNGHGTGLRELNAVFSGLLARDLPDEFFVSIEGGRAEGVQGEPVSGNYFDVLGVGPYLGRTFSLEDERPPGNQVVVLSYGYWRARFGGEDIEGTAKMKVTAEIKGLGRQDEALEQLVVRLSLEAGVSSVSWAVHAHVLE